MFDQLFNWAREVATKAIQVIGPRAVTRLIRNLRKRCAVNAGRLGNLVQGYPFLTVANANLIVAHGSPQQKTTFASKELSGDWFGTMCISEPQAGSSLSDITTKAVPDGEAFDIDPLGPRYRLRGNKMWISGGDHEITDNIIHLVLAKVPDADGNVSPGTRGISLFIVPKHLVDEGGNLTGERNDVALAGLNHKLGHHGTTNALLNFGEGRYKVRGRDGAIGYRIGNQGEGLKYMFHMMNEARIGVGLGAVVLGTAGYEASLAYAKERSQGRPANTSGKDVNQKPVRIIEHADVKRMLLAQKSYCEGALALSLYCGSLVDEEATGTPASAVDARLLLEILTPIAKSWPSEWCLEANSLAIQVLGGAGYTRDFPVEMFWRDNRLNMIHEGTHGIQGLDLLGRKVVMQEGAAFKLLVARMHRTIAEASKNDLLREASDALRAAVATLVESTETAWAGGSPLETLANATPYLQAFGHVVIAWIWLELATVAVTHREEGVRLGKLSACRYFYHYELPKIAAWLEVVRSRDQTCASMCADWF